MHNALSMAYGQTHRARAAAKRPSEPENQGREKKSSATRSVAWPSGLRRWFKAPVSSEAWVRIPPLPQYFAKFDDKHDDGSDKMSNFFYILNIR